MLKDEEMNAVLKLNALFSSVIKDDPDTKTATLIVVYVGRKQFPDMYIADLADKLNLSVRTVYRSLKALKKHKFL